MAPLCPAQDTSDTATINAQETARRRAAARDALMQVQEARLAYSAKRYTQAVELYRNALAVLPKGEETKKLETYICESLSDALIARAIDYRSVGRTREAMDFLREAVQLAPNNQRAKIELAYTGDAERTNPALDPEHKGNIEEVARLLALGYGYLNLGKYDDALRTFQAVSRYDQYNEAAKRGIERVNESRSAYYNTAHDARRSGMLAEVGKTWDISDDDEKAPGLPAWAEHAEHTDAQQIDALENAHAELLDRIQIPQFVLEEAGLEESIRILIGIVRQNENAMAHGQPRFNITTDLGPRNSELYNSIVSKRVSLNLADVSLREAVSEVARLFGLEYYVVSSGLELTCGEQSERIITRTFTGINPYVFDLSGVSSADDDDDDTGSSGRMHVSRVDPMAFFKAQGISFPKGSRVSYFPNARRLEVSNTRHNLDLIASVLDNAPTNEWNVVLNVIMMEVSEDDLEDLGFDWLFQIGGSEITGGGGLDTVGSAITSLPLVSTGRPMSSYQPPAATGGLRSIYQADGNRNLDTLIEQGSVRAFQSLDTSSAPSIFGLRGVWTAADVSVIMRGLAQKKGTDMLYNPRIVIDPSAEETVSFINVREMFIPSNYDPPQITSTTFNRNNNRNNGNNNNNNRNNSRYGGSSAVAIGAQPTEFIRYGTEEEQLNGIGAIVQVHKAEPTSDGRQVRLAITSIVNDFEGFLDWGSPIYTALRTASLTGSRIDSILLTPNHIFQPIFKRYLTNTNITIADGAVLVMGGMRESRIVRYQDKVPILGDLPLVGRLFRSEGEHKSRRALLIFAKVNIVDPTGKRSSGDDSGEDIAAQSPIP